MKKPNILYITTDQQHYRMMSCAGNPWLKTPNMDRIAASGTLFSRCYAANPVCSPSRFSMYSGRMPSAINQFHNGGQFYALSDSEREDCLGHLLRKAGYQTWYGGKHHFPVGLTPENTGWDFRLLQGEDRLYKLVHIDNRARADLLV